MTDMRNQQFSRSNLVCAVFMALLALLPPALFGASGPAIVTNQPANLIVLQDSPATFTVVADGTAPINYQWWRGGAPIAGATSSGYTLASAQPTDDYAQFSVVVSNSLGSSTSTVAVLRVDPGMPGAPYATNLITITDTAWRYFSQTAVNLGTAWRETNFNDTAWSSGLGLFGLETTPDEYLPYTFRTTLVPQGSGGPVTTYYRTHFNLPADPAFVTLTASNKVDDGAVFYLNGGYAGSFRVSAAPNQDYLSGADLGTEGAWDIISIPTTNLLRGDNVMAVEVHQSGTTSSDVVFGMDLFALISSRVPDTNAPTLERILPAPGLPVTKLFTIELLFSEPVTNVDAQDLLINNVPATNVTWQAPRTYIFEFPQPPTGTVQITWAANHGIRDLALLSTNSFDATGWSYTLDPNAVTAPLFITEFMAANKGGYTNVIRDSDGDYSDWIEIYNAGNATANLDGWFLTDSPANLTQWRFPAVSLAAGRYMLVFASGKNRTNINAQLHTNFQLARENGYLAIVAPGTNVVMQYAPTYPTQETGVSYGLVASTTNTFGYFVVPTPGSANTTVGNGFAPEVQFSQPSGTFVNNFNLVLSTPSTNAIIRYILVNATSLINTPVSDTSPIYTGPLLISGSVVVRARAYQTGLLPGPQHSETYLKLDATVVSRKSDLPLIVLHDFGQGDPPTTKPDQFVVCQVFMPKNGVSAMTNKPDLSFHGIFHRRGSSTVGQAKANLLVEAQDELGNDMTVPFVDLPEESDWVLYAPNNFDRAQIHNPVAMDIYRKMGHYSSRSRMVEVYLQDDSGAVNPVKEGDYNGIYVVLEKIKIGKNRLDIGKVRPENTTSPSITGGYLFSRDRANTGEGQATYASEGSINWLDPDYLEIQSAAFTPQRNYLASWFSEFYSVGLMGAAWTNRDTGYAKYIDVPVWIDYHIQNVVTFNVDGLRLSGYFHKAPLDPENPNSGRLYWGPQWDYDRTQGSADGRDFNPRTWRSPTSDFGTDMFNNTSIFDNIWYSRMFLDIDFWQAWIDRYQMWRLSVLANTNMYNLIDYYANQITNAQPRDAAKWPAYAPRGGSVTASGYTYVFPTPATYKGEIDFMKLWYSNRLDFIDLQLEAMPRLSRAGGDVPSGTTVTITGPVGATIYYTLDGTDPRPRGGAAGNALRIYSGPITITNNAKLIARAYDANHNNLTGANNPPLTSHWSGPATATFVVATPTIAITEIMFHPKSPSAGDTNDTDNFEFIEFKNIGANPVNLSGYKFTNGIIYTFPTNSPTLAAGGYAVLTKNVGSFQSRYPGVTNVLGGYYGFLDNAGEELALEGPLGELISRFSYNDAWFRMTDGNGFSLVLANEYTVFSAYTNPASWRLSALENGSPGAADPTPANIAPIYISEVSANPLPGQLDSIEIYNPNAFAVNVGDWYLSDDFGTPKKFRIPNPTLIPAGGYLVFTENDFNAPGALNGFALGARGDDAYIFSGNTNGLLTGYYHGFDFGPSPQGATYGRLVNSVGDDKFVLQTTNTLGTNNATAIVGPIVISEIMYHPPDLLVGTNAVDNQDDEFIELYNLSNQSVPLYDPAAATNTWHLRDAVSYVFPQGVVLPPNGYVVVVSFDPNTNALALATFLNRYNLTNGTPIFGPYNGKLNNISDNVELTRPGVPDLLPGTGLYAMPEILADKVSYLNSTPWPCGSDGTGNSLQRLQAAQFGNEPANWVADVPTPGAATVPKPAGLPTIINQPLSTAIPVGGNASFNVGVCGLPPFYYQWSRNGTNLPNATNAFLNISAAQLSQSGPYVVAVSNAAGVAYSLAANLYVQTPPGISEQPVGQTILGYTDTSFTVTPVGTPPFQYQWRFDGGNIAGATNQTLVLTNVQGSQAGQYSVLVFNTAGSILSSNAQLLVNLPARILVQPVDTKATNAQSASLIISATGNGPISYQWFFGANPIANATNNSLTLTNLALSQDGYYSVLVSNQFGTDLSRAAHLTVLMVPVFTISPTNQTLTIGSTLQMFAAFNGSQPLRVRWDFLGAVIPGFGFDRNSDTLLLPNVHPAMGGFYRATVTNELRPGGVGSSLAFVAIVTPPMNSQVIAGSNITLRAQASGFTLSFQWWRDGTNIAGATSTNLVLNNVQASDAGQYTFSVKNGALTNFYPMTLTVQSVGTAPEIVQQPTNRVVLTNLNTVIGMGATGTDPLSFQWYRDGTNLLTNAISPYLVLTNLQLAQSGLYQVVVTNAFGAVTSAPALLTVAELPTATMQPTALTVRAGSDIAFNPTYTGTQPRSYQWYLNSTTLLADATNATLLLDGVTLAQSGGYQVVVSNVVGVVTSAVGTLLVQAPPVITQSPASVVVAEGGSAQFTVAANGSQPLSYQWWFNNAPLAGATSNPLQLTNVQAAQVGGYYVVVTNSVGAATSAVATLSLPGSFVDTDGDGIPDSWEQQYGLLLNNPNDANLDADGDGLSNLQEYLAGTNPTNATSTLKLEVLTTIGVGNGAVFEFSAVSNKSYTVQFRDNLTATNWQRLFDVLAGTTNRTVALTNAGANTRFFRIATPIVP